MANNIDLKIKEIAENKIELEFFNAPTYFVNSIRRILISEIPKVAFTHVVFNENNTAFFEEYISHRIGLIPLKTDVKYYFDKKGNFKGLQKISEETYTYELSAENEDEDEIIVYSSQIRPLKDGYPKVVYDDIPVLALGPEQSINLTIYARAGIGKEHARYQVVSGIGVKPYPTIKIGGCQYPRGCPNAPCVEICPQNLLGKSKDKIEIKDVEKCKMCRDCVEVCPFGAIEISWEENHHIMKYETDGSMSALDALWAAAHVWRTKLKELKKVTTEMLERS